MSRYLQRMIELEMRNPFPLKLLSRTEAAKNKLDKLKLFQFFPDTTPQTYVLTKNQTKAKNWNAILKNMTCTAPEKKEHKHSAAIEVPTLIREHEKKRKVDDVSPESKPDPTKKKRIQIGEEDSEWAVAFDTMFVMEEYSDFSSSEYF